MVGEIKAGKIKEPQSGTITFGLTLELACRKKKEYSIASLLAFCWQYKILTAASVPSSNYIFFCFFNFAFTFHAAFFPDYGERERPAFLCAYVAS